MYIQISDKQYSCTGYATTDKAAAFSGVEGLTLPVSGTVRLCQDDGFVLAEQDCGSYARQTYADNILMLTNEAEAAAPTVEELRTAALARISGKCKAAIMAGVTVAGKHYTLSELDQLNLNAAVALANAGTAAIPFAADGEALTLYTADQIKTVGSAAYQWGVANQIYYALLQAWIARETDTAVLPVIAYGKTLPSDLTTTLTTDLTAARIDVATFTASLTA